MSEYEDVRMRRTTVRLSDDLSRRAKDRAARQQITFTQFIEDAVRNQLANPETLAPGERIVLPVFGDPAKALNWEDLKRQIEDQEWADDMKGLGIKAQDHDASA